MPCTSPKKCWVHGVHEKTGKDKYVFKKPHPDAEENIIPCGKCLSCQIDKSKEWATRGFHESQCHSMNAFITLTYAEENLPDHSTLVSDHLRNFLKLLRYHIKPLKIKYLAAGEYGSSENSHRPHYHICLFGFYPGDAKYLFTNKHGDPVYTSELISQCWQNKGYITVAPLTYRTVAYTARYTVKKIVTKEDRSQDDYWIDPETGETNYDPVAYKKGLIMKNKIPEFIRMSNGIGKNWHERFNKDTVKDFITVNYAKHKIPRYYDKLLEKIDPDLLAEIKEKRIAAAKSNVKTKQKLKSEEIIKKRQISTLERKL